MPNEYKTLAEWRRVYKEKEALLQEWGYAEVAPFDFYRELFPEGSLQKKGESHTGKGNIVANKLMLTRSRKVIISDGLEDLPKLMGARFGLIGPFSSYGDSYKAEYAHNLFAIVIDIDYVGKVHLKRLLREFQNWNENKPNSLKRMPPTYLVSSGRGIHLYYFLDEPIELFSHRIETLSALKTALTNHLWNQTTSLKGDEPDKSSIFQCFRCVGSLSKICLDKDRKKIVTDAYPVKAYKISDRRFSLYEIRDSIEGCKIDLDSLYRLPPVKKGKVSRAEAAELWPDWYDRRIVKGEPPKSRRKTWVCNIALYEWWKRTVREKAIVGGRYFTIVALCCYGRKCGLSDGKIRKDAWELYEFLDSITDDEANHFTRQDMRDALGVLKSTDQMQTVEHTREWIEAKTKIDIPPGKRYKKGVDRRYMPLMTHWEKRVLPAREMYYPDGEWRYKGGAPTKKDRVVAYRQEHPEASVTEVAGALKMSRTTVYKWWDAEPEAPEPSQVTLQITDGLEPLDDMDEEE